MFPSFYDENALRSTPKVNPNVNSGLWLAMVCQCEPIEYSTHASGAGHRQWGAVLYWGGVETLLTAQFCCELKLALKKQNPE